MKYLEVQRDEYLKNTYREKSDKLLMALTGDASKKLANVHPWKKKCKSSPTEDFGPCTNESKRHNVS